MMTWSSGSPLMRAACMAMFRLSLTDSCPTKSLSCLGLREESRASSSPCDSPETSRSVIGPAPLGGHGSTGSLSSHPLENRCRLPLLPWREKAGIRGNPNPFQSFRRKPEFRRRWLLGVRFGGTGSSVISGVRAFFDVSRCSDRCVLNGDGTPYQKGF